MLLHLTACARDELAPLALHAYPEAYLDFKRLLLLLVFQRDSSHSCPVSNDWSVEARSDLACTVFHTMRQHLGGFQYAKGTSAVCGSLINFA